ncbi:MAG: hypothetical protein JSW39_24360 [Desulfobacterales bacterium]|nr:MAG: hypothetical protein JSW39_24360 [Desulfobacterales bacterium]
MQESVKIAPQAVQGILDLTNWDIARDGPVKLNGQWEFYWERHLAPEDFARTDLAASAGMIEVPKAWNGHATGGSKIAGHGYATYRLQVLMAEPPPPLALKFLDMAVAFTAYVNGLKLLSAGVPGRTPETTVPRFDPQIVDFQPASQRIEIIVWVSNFHHRKGGAWEPIVLGPAADVRRIREKAIGFDLLLFGSILIMGIYHLGLYTIRRAEKAPLYFAVFCFLLAVRIITTGERYLVSL